MGVTRYSLIFSGLLIWMSAVYAEPDPIKQPLTMNVWTLSYEPAYRCPGITPIIVEIRSKQNFRGELRIFDNNLTIQRSINIGQGLFRYEFKFPNSAKTEEISIDLRGDTARQTMILKIVPLTDFSLKQSDVGWLTPSSIRPKAFKAQNFRHHQLNIAMLPLEPDLYEAYQVLVIAAKAAGKLNKKQSLAIDQWVKNGGKLIVSADAAAPVDKDAFFMKHFGLKISRTENKSFSIQRSYDSQVDMTPEEIEEQQVGTPSPSPFGPQTPQKTIIVTEKVDEDFRCSMMHFNGQPVEPGKTTFHPYGTGAIIISTIHLDDISDKTGKFPWVMEKLVFKDIKPYTPYNITPKDSMFNWHQEPEDNDVDKSSIDISENYMFSFDNIRAGMRQWSGIENINFFVITSYLLIFFICITFIERRILKKRHRLQLSWISTPLIIILFCFAARHLSGITRGFSPYHTRLIIHDFDSNNPGGQVTSFNAFIPALSIRKKIDLESGTVFPMNKFSGRKYLVDYDNKQLTVTCSAWTPEYFILSRRHNAAAPMQSNLTFSKSSDILSGSISFRNKETFSQTGQLLLIYNRKVYMQSYQTENSWLPVSTISIEDHLFGAMNAFDEQLTTGRDYYYPKTLGEVISSTIWSPYQLYDKNDMPSQALVIAASTKGPSQTLDIKKENQKELHIIKQLIPVKVND